MECSQHSQEEKVEYIAYANLVETPAKSAAQVNALATDQLNSANDWKRHFEALTFLRSYNKFHPQSFIAEVFPQVAKQVCAQVDNLRSTNSKQALVLLTQISTYCDLSQLPEPLLAAIVSKLFVKSCSEKGFLKQQALKGIKALEKATNPGLLAQISRQTQSANYLISQLAILTLKSCLENKMLDNQCLDLQDFFRILAKNLNGKRSMIQKTSKEIVCLLDKHIGTEKLLSLIQSLNLAKQEQEVLTVQVRNSKAAGPSKAKVSLKDFLKQKKQEAPPS